jgi:putative Holliday junction resolvase
MITALSCIAVFCVMDRILAIDYGRRRIGLAISDELGFAAHGLPTLNVPNKDQALAEVVCAILKHRPGQVVVGLPLNLDGSRSEMSDVVDMFVEKLRERVTAPICLLDERLTSVAAKRTMREMGVKQKGRKESVDRLAAVYLLEIFLQQQKTEASG